MNPLKIYSQESNYSSVNHDKNDRETDISHPHQTTNNIVPQKNQKWLIFDPDIQNQASLGLIKLDAQFTFDNYRPIKKQKQIRSQKAKHQSEIVCSLCQWQLESPQSLGGHIAFYHRNQSKNSQFRKERKESNKFDLMRTRQIQQITQDDLEIF